MILKNNKAALHLFFGGILPVVAFTVIEDKYGVVAGLIAGMVFGVGEIAWELYSEKKVSGITLASNAMILILGGISLVTQEGFWFKMQPAIMEAAFAIVLIISWLLKKPLLRTMMIAQQQKQNPESPGLPDIFVKALSGMTLRTGIFFAIHAVLATYAALHWSSDAWALLKGVGLTVSFILYMFAEMLFIRIKNQ